MSWITVSPLPAAERAGSVPPDRPALCPDAAMELTAEGTLFVEADLSADLKIEQTLFVMHRADDAKSHVSLHLGQDGTVTYARRLGDTRQEVVIRAGDIKLQGTLRLTVSWNRDQGVGVFSIELAETGILLQQGFDAPIPLTAGDACLIQSGGPGIVQSPAVVSVSLSNRREPVGICPSFAADTPILTPEGYRAIQNLRKGDLVLDDRGQAHPIRWVGHRDVPARGRFRPVRLFAPYFGLIRDIVVSPEQRLVVRGAEVEYLFGEEAILTEASTLVATNFAAPEPVGATFRYYHVLLDHHETLIAAGAEVESLFIGNLGDLPATAATTVLNHVPAGELPLHRKLAHRALRNFEAVTLRAALLSR